MTCDDFREAMQAVVGLQRIAVAAVQIPAAAFGLDCFGPGPLAGLQANFSVTRVAACHVVAPPGPLRMVPGTQYCAVTQNRSSSLRALQKGPEREFL